MERLIHIHAKCDFFEIFEQVEESKSVARLKKIKGLYIEECKRRKLTRSKINKSHSLFVLPSAGGLKVNTILLNPTLFSV